MNNEEIMKMTEDYVMNTYGRFPMAFVSGKGARLTDADGREYLDFIAGLAVCNLGHCHPKVVAAIEEQARNLLHTSNLFHIAPQARLAELIAKNSFAGKSFFCNSGAEAVEAAIKLARKYFSSKGESHRYQIISMEKSFHGRTMAAMAATGQKKVQEGFEPLLEKFTYVPFGDSDAVKSAINENTAALLVEPIQGEGGVNMPKLNYFQEVREICNEAGVLLIMDEVQTGMGRTGKLFGYEHHDIEPDIMTLAKALGSGVAVGAMVATDEVAEAFTQGSHASTFGGNFLAMAAAIAAMEVTLEDGFLERSVEVGNYLRGQLRVLKSKYGFIDEIRGVGLMVAMELTMPGAPVVKDCLDKGLIINCTAEKVLRFLPPLIITNDDVDEMIEILDGVFDGYEE